jgi:hypothetical protein
MCLNWERAVENLSSGSSRLWTVLPINLLDTGDDMRSKQSCRQGGGRKDMRGMTWPVSTEIAPSAVCVGN